LQKQRTASLGLTNIIEFKEIDAERIDTDLQPLLQLSSFNAVLCRWELMFVPNLTSTLTSIYKLLSSGEKVAAAVWSEPKKVPKLYAVIDFVIRNVGISSTITDNHSSNYAKIFSPFRLTNINIVKDALVEAGFKDIHIEYLSVAFEFASAEEYVRFAKTIIAPLQDILDNETERRREEIWKMLTKEVDREYVTVSNYNNNIDHNRSIRMDNETICIVERKL
jgi:enediyne biosynthesis protein CalE5